MKKTIILLFFTSMGCSQGTPVVAGIPLTTPQIAAIQSQVQQANSCIQLLSSFSSSLQYSINNGVQVGFSTNTYALSPQQQQDAVGAYLTIKATCTGVLDNLP